MHRTPQTVAANLNRVQNSLRNGTKKSYPNGPGTRPVLVPLTADEADEDRRNLRQLAEELHQVDPAAYRAWINAGAGSNPENHLSR